MRRYYIYKLKYTTLLVLCIFITDLFAGSSSDINRKINELLKKHPEVSLKFLEAKEKGFRSKHADVYPDPKIGFAFRSYPYRSGFDTDRARPDTPSMTGKEYSISQEIPFPGRLNLEKQILKSDSELDYWSGVWVQNEFMRSYFELVLSIAAIERELNDLLSIEKQLNTKVKLESSQYISEQFKLSNLIKTKNQIERIKDRVIEKTITLKELKQSVEFYSNHIGANSITEEEIIGYLANKESNIEQELSGDSLSKFPLIQFAEVNQSKAIVESKKDEILHLPDFEIFLSYMQRKRKPFLLDSGPLNLSIMDNPEFAGDLWSAGVTIRVPVWSLSKIDELNQSNAIRITRLQKEKEKEQIRLKSEYQATIEAWLGNKQRFEHFKNNLLPSFQKNIKSSLSSYAKGESVLGESYDLIVESLEMQSQLHQIQFKRWSTVLKLLQLTNHLLPEGEIHED
ncbi:TolC family protein [Leptospira sp. 2 VSF19]|uniref:TolC family protein n=1 Tax=Leptospira soteropolitanensis TaxID=2950025 RepID=A0AAW5VJE9_9LEPT|nr:TolC family protein [Leptospira soteropolitanensis]MCW7492612.1 TolC family protein [Leptospira soteropolitanensis]MCW7500295.1 TolC family protein [Leptospira soteropolitanensis]MCW7522670.1 TolC family protein [Leptospira soteropolitanensis]MCW7526526.1 TolC family protein [Leptospira soteropolitanensis]MCW7530265.1 TolC family protein [Leptospira soteropolitanensis]